MTSLVTFLHANPHVSLALAGLLIGLGFGAIASLSNFCVMGAVSDWQTSGSAGRLGMVAVAAAISILGAQTLDALALTDLKQSMYLAPNINWAGAMLGGLLFGFGMVQAGGCASRNLVRAGSGDVRSAIVLVTMAIATFAAISGIFGSLRADFESATAIAPALTGLATPSTSAAAEKLGLAAAPARLVASVLLIIPLLWFAFQKSRVHREPRLLGGGIATGLLVIAGWFATGLMFDEMALKPNPPASLSFVRPVADAIDWLERSTALGLPGFGAATVFGVLTGSAMVSTLRGSFRLQTFADKGDLVRHLGGALAMGIGGVFALGCSIGQGLTGLSTLSIQSMLAAVSILAGASLGLRHLEKRL